MADVSRAAVVVEPGHMEVREFPLPAIGNDDALLRVEMVGVCGTDPKIYHGKSKITRGFPVILGHEILGRIDRIGPEAADRWKVSEGDRVVVETKMGCGWCLSCTTGAYNLCDESVSYGSTHPTTHAPALWGAYSEYMYLAPRSMVHKISEEVPAETGTLVCAVLGNQIKWTGALGGVSFGDTVVIQGSGPQGLVAAVVARECGADQVIMTGLSADADRFRLGKEFGVDVTVDVSSVDAIDAVGELTGGRMADVVVDVTGSPVAMATSLDLVRKRGTVVCAGISGTDTETTLHMDKIVFKQIRLQGAYSHTVEHVAPALRFVERNRQYALEKIVTHCYSLDEAETAVLAAGYELADLFPTKVAIRP